MSLQDYQALSNEDVHWNSPNYSREELKDEHLLAEISDTSISQMAWTPSPWFGAWIQKIAS